MKTILEMNDFEIIETIQSGRLNICVIGIGRIGLPTALSFANSGLTTIGIDINEQLVEMINSGNFPLKDEPGYDVIFNEVVTNKKFYASTEIEEIVPNSNVILLSLPTPMNDKNITTTNAAINIRIIGSLTFSISLSQNVAEECSVKALEPCVSLEDITSFLERPSNSIIAFLW